MRKHMKFQGNKRNSWQSPMLHHDGNSEDFNEKNLWLQKNKVVNSCEWSTSWTFSPNLSESSSGFVHLNGSSCSPQSRPQGPNHVVNHKSLNPKHSNIIFDPKKLNIGWQLLSDWSHLLIWGKYQHFCSILIFFFSYLSQLVARVLKLCSMSP